MRTVKTIVWVGIVLAALLPPPVVASPMVDHYTSCSGSWDGPGKTACEILGVPGVVYVSGMDFSPYSPSFVVLHEITALDWGNSLLVGSTLKYWTGTRELDSSLHPLQFAYWEDEEGLKVGIEDLTDPSDWDYNDFVIALERVPDEVPEPTLLALMGMGLLGAIRRRR